MRVINLMEAEVDGCRCGSWLKHWDAFSQQKAGYCMVRGCKGKPEIGGKVQKVGEPGRIYIVPLCQRCAHKHGFHMEIVDGVSLVPADSGVTCGPEDLSPVRVRLAEGKAASCRCGNWLKHWQTFSRQRAGYCMVDGCTGKPEVGAEVEKLGEPGRIYVVPLCKACAARRGEDLAIAHGADLVPITGHDACAVKLPTRVRVMATLNIRYEGCRCGDWLAHWNGFSGQRAGYCMASGCKGKPEIGAIVQKEGEPGKTYAVPLCRACAARQGGLLTIASGVHLVPTDPSETCGKDQDSYGTDWTIDVA